MRTPYAQTDYGNVAPLDEPGPMNPNPPPPHLENGMMVQRWLEASDAWQRAAQANIDRLGEAVKELTGDVGDAWQHINAIEAREDAIIDLLKTAVKLISERDA